MSAAIQISPIPETQTYSPRVYWHQNAISPDQAVALLEAQPQGSNRAIDQTRVQQYARDMASGAWHPDVGSILIAADGSLIDGQHRLLAIVAANIAVVIPVTHNVDPEAMKFVDTGKHRTTFQTLHLLGHKLPTVQIATANLLAHYRRITASGLIPLSARQETLNPDAVVRILAEYATPCRAMQQVLQEHNASAIYAPLVFAYASNPDAAATAMAFIRDGQVRDNPVLAKFHPAQRKLARDGLGGSIQRVNTQLWVFELVRALALGHAPSATALTKITSAPFAQRDLIRFFLQRN